MDNCSEIVSKRAPLGKWSSKSYKCVYKIIIEDLK